MVFNGFQLCLFECNSMVASMYSSYYPSLPIKLPQSKSGSAAPTQLLLATLPWERRVGSCLPTSITLTHTCRIHTCRDSTPTMKSGQHWRVWKKKIVVVGLMLRWLSLGWIH